MNKRGLSYIARRILFVGILGYASISNSATQMDGNIKWLQLVPSGTVYIIGTSTPTNSLPAGCGNGGFWHYTLAIGTPVGNAMYSTLLAAYSSGVGVTLFGLDVCNEDNSVESLKTIRLK